MELSLPVEAWVPGITYRHNIGSCGSYRRAPVTSERGNQEGLGNICRQGTWAKGTGTGGRELAEGDWGKGTGAGGTRGTELELGKRKWRQG